MCPNDNNNLYRSWILTRIIGLRKLPISTPIAKTSAKVDQKHFQKVLRSTEWCDRKVIFKIKSHFWEINEILCHVRHVRLKIWKKCLDPDRNQHVTVVPLRYFSILQLKQLKWIPVSTSVTVIVYINRLQYEAITRKWHDNFWFLVAVVPIV